MKSENLIGFVTLHSNCFQSSFATDDKEGHGFKPFFNTLPAKINKKVNMVIITIIIMIIIIMNNNNKKERSWTIIDIACLFDHRVNLKEQEKIEN